MKIGHVFDGKKSFILTLFLGDFLYSIALAQDFTDKYVLPVVLVYPSEKYAYLAECKQVTKGGDFPEIAVFVIE